MRLKLRILEIGESVSTIESRLELSSALPPDNRVDLKGVVVALPWRAIES
jgi:hypothetical protein